MKNLGIIACCFIAATSEGCGIHFDSSARSQKGSTVVKQDPSALAKQIRAAMTSDEMMKLEYEGPRAHLGTRGYRQRELARPLMRQLISYGKDAEEPLWRLVTDEDESVRRSIIMLIRVSKFDAYGENEIESKAIEELAIPILERALQSEDPVVRFEACGNLGDYSSYSDDSLDRLRLSLAKLQDLKNDEDEEVRGIAYVATNSLLCDLSTRGKTPEARLWATDKQKEHSQEEDWRQ